MQSPNCWFLSRLAKLLEGKNKYGGLWEKDVLKFENKQTAIKSGLKPKFLSGASMKILIFQLKRSLMPISFRILSGNLQKKTGEIFLKVIVSSR